MVEKANKSLRISLDPLELNKIIKRDYYLIPKIDEIRSQLFKKIFTVIDLKEGFGKCLQMSYICSNHTTRLLQM